MSITVEYELEMSETEAGTLGLRRSSRQALLVFFSMQTINSTSLRKKEIETLFKAGV